MIALITLFAPAVLAVGLFEKLSKRELGAKKWLYRFCFNALAINLIVFLIKKVILHTSTAPLYSLLTDMTPEVVIRYLIMAIPAAVVLVVVEILLSRHVKVGVEEEKE